MRRLLSSFHDNAGPRGPFDPEGRARSESGGKSTISTGNKVGNLMRGYAEKAEGCQFLI
jgi:hypothetical protein